MKRNLVVFVVFLFIAVGISAQVVKPLDAVIEEAAKTIENALPQGTKLAVLNFTSSSETFSNYVIDEFTGALVRGRKVVMVDRQNLALIRQEMNLQLSGDVSDESVLSIGRQVGAQSIVSGALTNLGNYYRFRVRVINVETAAIQEQYSYNMQNDAQVAFLLSGNQGSTPTSSSTTTQRPAQATTSQTSSSVSNVNVVNGTNLQEKLKWLEANAVNNTEYRIDVIGNESISSQTISLSGKRNVKVRIISTGGEKIISNTGRGAIFTIESGVTFILDNGVTLQGRNDNDVPLVIVNSRGEFIMNNGAKITGNTNTGSRISGGGIRVEENAIFTMNGGEITNNRCSNSNNYLGGGVSVSGIFTMTTGKISGNTSTGQAFSGGGVSVQNYGKFTMNGGEITNNSTDWDGGGVCVVTGGTFTMNGGEIYNNKSKRGGGVSLANWIYSGGTFTMTSGEIAGNTASEVGGGVYSSGGTFTKTGGTIYGNEGTHNDNRATGNGHAVNSNGLIRNSTAGSSIRLNSNTRGSAGGWEN